MKNTLGRGEGKKGKERKEKKREPSVGNSITCLALKPFNGIKSLLCGCGVFFCPGWDKGSGKKGKGKKDRVGRKSKEKNLFEKVESSNGSFGVCARLKTLKTRKEAQ